jgi:hypothetical protein
LVLSITDPEVTRALEQHEEGPPRDAYAKQALRLGILAFQQTAGALDAETVQREGERLLGSVREALNEHTSQTSSSIARLLGGYLDPATGSLPQRLERLTKRDGEIESLLAKHLDGDRSTIAETLARKVGEESALFKLLSPSSADGLAGTVTRAIEEALRVQRDEVLRQFSLNDADSALSRLAREIAQANSKLRGEVAADVAEVKSALSFENDQTPMSRFVLRVEKAQRSVLDQLSLDCEGSAVRRLSLALDDTCATVRRSLTLDDKGSPLSLLRQELIGAVASFTESNAQFQADVRTTLATFRVRREEAARGSLHGHAFEDAAGELLQQEARRLGDVCDRLSGTPGRDGRKTGDYVLILGPESAAPGGRIVCECKAQKGYTEADALEELVVARKNRAAEVGVLILARESASPGFEPFRRVGMDLLVIWDESDATTDVYVKAAVSVARALVIQKQSDLGRSSADVVEIEQCIRSVEGLVAAVDSMAHDAQIVIKRGTRIGKTSNRVRERLAEEVERLMGVVEGMGRGKGE